MGYGLVISKGDTQMIDLFVFTITLENTKTGEISRSLVFRGKSEADAREYAEAAIKQHNRPELRVHSIYSRPA